MNLVKFLCCFIALLSPTNIDIIDSLICLSQNLIHSILAILEFETHCSNSNIASFFTFNYEFFPRTNPFSSQLHTLPLDNKGSILYPFVFLNVYGKSLFSFAYNNGLLLDYTTNTIIRTYPFFPGGDPRTYLNSGLATLLPLRDLELGINVKVEVLICGVLLKGPI